MCPNPPGVTGLYLEKIIILPVGGFPRVCEFSKRVLPPSDLGTFPPIHLLSVRVYLVAFRVPDLEGSKEDIVFLIALGFQDFIYLSTNINYSLGFILSRSRRLAWINQAIK